MSFVDYPFHVDAHGRSAHTGENDYIRDLIEQVLFTTPGERVNRPDFGCGLSRLVFAPNSEQMATATQSLVQGALQQWLGELIQIEAVRVKSVDSSLYITVQYIINRNRERKVERYSREVS